MNSSSGRPSKPAALLRLKALMAEMVSLLLGGTVRVRTVRWNRRGTSPDVIRSRTALKCSLHLISCLSLWTSPTVRFRNTNQTPSRYHRTSLETHTLLRPSPPVLESSNQGILLNNERKEVHHPIAKYTLRRSCFPNLVRVRWKA